MYVVKRNTEKKRGTGSYEIFPSRFLHLKGTVEFTTYDVGLDYRDN